jgi:hypothetical protein
VESSHAQLMKTYYDTTLPPHPFALACIESLPLSRLSQC